MISYEGRETWKVKVIYVYGGGVKFVAIFIEDPNFGHFCMRWDFLVIV